VSGVCVCVCVCVCVWVRQSVSTGEINEVLDAETWLSLKNFT